MKARTLSYVGIAFVTAFASLATIVTPTAFAASIAWDGEGADNNFSTAANWAGDVIPVNGDSITFDLATGISEGDVFNNDLTGLQLVGISVTGSNDWNGITIAGNSFEISGTISTSYSGATYFGIESDITFTGDVSVTGTNSLFVNTASTIDLAGHQLSVSNYSTYIEGTIIGAGGITTTSVNGLYLTGVNTMSAAITIAAGSLNADADALGSGPISVTGMDSQLKFCGPNGATVNNAITLNSNPLYPAINSLPSCYMGGPADSSNPLANVTLSGSVLLQKNSLVGSSGVMTITGALTGSYTISLADGQIGSLVINSSNNTSNTPNGNIQSTAKVTEITDKAPASNVTVPANEIVVIKEGGERGTIFVEGGTLKGIGTVGTISMNLGKVAPGLSPGILNTGNLVFGGGTLEIELGGTTAGNGDGFHDQTNVTGTVDLGTNVTALSLIHWNNFRPALNNQFVIINNDGSDAVTGTFQNLGQGATVTVDGIEYTISYTGGDGNDVVLTATTVPATPAAPNTGFGLVTSYPLATIAVTILALGSLIYTKKLHTVKNK